jgi:hypothetical protein
MEIEDIIIENTIKDIISHYKEMGYTNINSSEFLRLSLKILYLEGFVEGYREAHESILELFKKQ